jgi:hypothetical protein
MAKRKPARRFLRGYKGYPWVLGMSTGSQVTLMLEGEAKGRIKEMVRGATIYELVPVNLGK